MLTFSGPQELLAFAFLNLECAQGTKSWPCRRIMNSTLERGGLQEEIQDDRECHGASPKSLRNGEAGCCYLTLLGKTFHFHPTRLWRTSAFPTRGKSNPSFQPNCFLTCLLKSSSHLKMMQTSGWALLLCFCSSFIVRLHKWLTLRLFLASSAFPFVPPSHSPFLSVLFQLGINLCG